MEQRLQLAEEGVGLAGIEEATALTRSSWAGNKDYFLRRYNYIVGKVRREARAKRILQREKRYLLQNLKEMYKDVMND